MTEVAAPGRIARLLFVFVGGAAQRSHGDAADAMVDVLRYVVSGLKD